MNGHTIGFRRQTQKLKLHSGSALLMVAGGFIVNGARKLIV